MLQSAAAKPNCCANCFQSGTRCIAIKTVRVVPANRHPPDIPRCQSRSDSLPHVVIHHVSQQTHAVPVQPFTRRHVLLSALLANLLASSSPLPATAAATKPSESSTLSASAPTATPLPPSAASPSSATTALAESPIRPLDELVQVATGRQQVAPLEYAKIRLRCGFKRLIDGRVVLRSKSGDWVMVKPDMKVAGVLLLRDPTGRISYISSDTYRQIDLSDDVNVAYFFSSGEWEQQQQVVTLQDDKGVLQPLRLGELQFRNIITIFQEQEVERLEKLDHELQQQQHGHNPSAKPGQDINWGWGFGGKK